MWAGLHLTLAMCVYVRGEWGGGGRGMSMSAVPKLRLQVHEAPYSSPFSNKPVDTV